MLLASVREPHPCPTLSGHFAFFNLLVRFLHGLDRTAAPSKHSYSDTSDIYPRTPFVVAAAPEAPCSRYARKAS